MLTKSIETF